MLFSALITPMILIVLYATFLANVYKDSFQSALPEFMDVSEKLINGTVASQLAAALLAVSCVTVTFCVNLTMIQDRANGSRKDFNVAPVKKPVIYLGYFFSTVLNSLMVNVLALVICLAYVKTMGWYLGAGDVLLLLSDIVLLVLFGTVLSSIVCNISVFQYHVVFTKELVIVMLVAVLILGILYVAISAVPEKNQR